MDDKNILEKVSDNIRLARLQKRISQEKLAEMVDISTKYLNMIENRKAIAPIPAVGAAGEQSHGSKTKNIITEKSRTDNDMYPVFWTPVQN